MAVMALVATAAGGSKVEPATALRSCYVSSNCPNPPKPPRSVNFGDDWNDHKRKGKPLAEVTRYNVPPDLCWRAGGFKKAGPALGFGEYKGEWFLTRATDGEWWNDEAPGLGQDLNPDRTWADDAHWSTEELLE